MISKTPGPHGSFFVVLYSPYSSDGYTVEFDFKKRRVLIFCEEFHTMDEVISLLKVHCGYDPVVVGEWWPIETLPSFAFDDYFRPPGYCQWYRPIFYYDYFCAVAVNTGWEPDL